MKTIYLECHMGAAGDMLMSALYELCPQKELFLQTINEALAPFSVSITAEPAVKCGICGTHMRVAVLGSEETALEADSDSPSPPSHQHSHTRSEHAHTEHETITGGEHVYGMHAHSHAAHTHDPHSHTHEHEHEHPHTDYASILVKISSLPLADEVKQDACAIYRLIGEAEARVHGTTLEQIHFHEVGTLDALADVVGCSLLIHMLAPEQILASPVHVGNGFIRCAHGVLPVPAPATAELLRGIPYYMGSVTSELCTPTGAALLKHYVTRFLPMPAMTTAAIGYGMGTKDFEIANCVRAFWGESASLLSTEDEDSFPCDDTVLAISCNLDDMTGEAIGLAVELLAEAGALDVWTAPIQMKKNRPGVLLTCLCTPNDREKFTGLFFLHTTTRGVRFQTFERAKLDSSFQTLESSYGKIRIKRSVGYGIEKTKPEFKDLKAAVRKNGCSLDDVTQSLQHAKPIRKQ